MKKFFSSPGGVICLWLLLGIILICLIFVADARQGSCREYVNRLVIVYLWGSFIVSGIVAYMSKRK